MTISRSSLEPELYLPLDRNADRPLYQQLEQALRDAVRGGRLAAGAPLPSSRTLAGQLGVTRGVVVSAYEQLSAEGYLITRPGASTRVARVPSAVASSPVAVRRQFGTDFRPGRPDVTEFPRTEWLRSLRRVIDVAPADRLNYLDGGGMPELRTALATYLNRVRGTSASADGIVITTGVAQAMHLVTRALRGSGARRIAVEDPFHPDYRQMFGEDGLSVVAIPVDDDGMRVDLLDAAGVDAVVVTPAHQYPTGAVLSAERRAALIGWADRHDGVVIEDDYDAEFRYDRVPVGAMQGLCADRVIYAGTASKTLAPGLRLGWLAVPPRLRDSIVRAKLDADQGSSALDQLALADFIDHGELDRHLRRMRVIYRHRRDALLEALERHLPDWTPTGASAGLHVLAWLPTGADEARIVTLAAEEDIGLFGVAASCHFPDARAGVIFGYGSIDVGRIEPGIAVLARALHGER